MTQLSEVDIAPASDPTWRALVSGEKQPEYRCLALRIMMIRIRGAYERNESALHSLIVELRQFFVANLRFAAPDYNAIFKSGAR